MLVTLTGLIFLSSLIEGIITYIFGKKEKNAPSRWYIPYLSLALGIALATAYNIRIPQMLAQVFGFGQTIAWVDYILSGIIIGRGSNYVNDIFGRFRASK